MEETRQQSDQNGPATSVRPALLVIITAVIFFALGYGAAWIAFNSVFSGQDALAQVVNNAVNRAFAEYDIVQERAAAAAAPAPEPEAPTVQDINVDDDPAFGPEDAPIVIVEFSDFRCGFCARFHTQTFETLKTQYEGQIRFVYRDFPVVGGEQAALAAECVHDQGEDLFWDYHDLLFQNQQSVADPAALSELASRLDLNQDTFETCLAEETHRAEIENDFAEGLSYGVRGTPAFFINGRAVVGAQPLATFQQIIDEELALVEAG
ncbi:MAG: DsbA family protein [Anaerolineae bacterium]|nr:DsbA family protein [Anaerolineae bacterium]